MNVDIRKAHAGDEKILAYIQTESWKAAFSEILDDDTLKKYTDIDRITRMYARDLANNTGNTYILSVEGKPHCIAYWDGARDELFAGKAELYCIHSLRDGWHKGYGSMMMDRILQDVESAGYSEVVLWVFKDNHRARSFYESKGFSLTDISKHLFETEEVAYAKQIR